MQPFAYHIQKFFIFALTRTEIINDYIIMNLLEQLGKAIVSRRKELGISQDELSEKSGVSRRYLSDVENGTRQISVIILKSLTDQLDWTLTQLFSTIEPQVKLKTNTPDESELRAIKIGKVIKKHRTEENLSEELFSEILGISPNKLEEIESGKDIVSVQILEKIAIALRITLSALIRETEG